MRRKAAHGCGRCRIVYDGKKTAQTACSGCEYRFLVQHDGMDSFN